MDACLAGRRKGCFVALMRTYVACWTRLLASWLLWSVPNVCIVVELEKQPRIQLGSSTDAPTFIETSRKAKQCATGGHN
jgi:hypothetical protein